MTIQSTLAYQPLPRPLQPCELNSVDQCDYQSSPPSTPIWVITSMSSAPTPASASICHVHTRYICPLLLDLEENAMIRMPFIANFDPPRKHRSPTIASPGTYSHSRPRHFGLSAVRRTLHMHICTICQYPSSGPGTELTNPFGWPVNLSHKIVTRFIVPHAWKCACISSGVAP